ncbi:unnamed protein product [Macrosiphum euphorbiae]|uniref:Uncharacterized protein n=1 Tax=Macrosiphum euphorbiae TaxID=13131 RepID=A0AAV0W4Y3_9HEMI|nr:unnamed protein product [Macrosiphum euphorbiae]
MFDGGNHEKEILQWLEDTSIIQGSCAEAITNILGKADVKLNVENFVLDKVPIYILSDTSHPRESIVGRPFCESPHVAFVKYHGKLKFYNTNFPFADHDLLSNEDSDSILRISEEVVIPTGLCTWVNVLGSDTIIIAAGNDGISEEKMMTDDILCYKVTF